MLAGEVPNFQAMTKAEITAFCASTFGVSLDGSMTKAELVASATALLQRRPHRGHQPKEPSPPRPCPRLLHPTWPLERTRCCRG